MHEPAVHVPAVHVPAVHEPARIPDLAVLISLCHPYRHYWALMCCRHLPLWITWDLGQPRTWNQTATLSARYLRPESTQTGVGHEVLMCCCVLQPVAVRLALCPLSSKGS